LKLQCFQSGSGDNSAFQVVRGDSAGARNARLLVLAMEDEPAGLNMGAVR
jgi:hypothetical protein